MLYTAQNGFKSLAAEKGCHMRFRVLNGKSPVCQPDQSVFVGIPAGKQCAPTGRTGGRSTERMTERQRIFSKSLHMGGRNIFSIYAGETPGVVSMNIENIFHDTLRSLSKSSLTVPRMKGAFTPTITCTALPTFTTPWAPIERK